MANHAPNCEVALGVGVFCTCRELTSFDRLARLEQGQDRLMARLDEHDEWAKSQNAAVKKAQEAYLVEHDKSVAGFGELITQMVKGLARLEYMETVLNHIYDFQRKPKPKPPRRAKKKR